ncbi:hypothetical protein TNCV_2267551 [Trichonephila clavipes]|nr:hypothetical protein TNCV_2267551 [Trichonephila clavipes]
MGVCDLLKEVETHQVMEEPAEIMHFFHDSESKYEKKQRFSKEGLELEIDTLSYFLIFSKDLYFVFKTATAENPVSQRYDVENGNSVRNAFVFSAENSSSTSALN